ncbi:hypothetical protein JTB14_031892 [Gonioctena quinquepunctata]|nr:hypothetical protein JTB14_031892 [Gonioctena quinquepunctata]
MKQKRYRSSSSSSSSSSEDFDILKREHYHLRKKLKRLKKRRVGWFCEKPTIEGDNPLEIEFVDVSPNENIINALGGLLEENSLKQGEEIHYDLAKRWDAILMKDLDDPSKKAIFLSILLQVIVPVLAPPKLNPEIKVAAKDTAVTRDTSLELEQSQTRATLTTIGKC